MVIPNSPVTSIVPTALTSSVDISNETSRSFSGVVEPMISFGTPSAKNEILFA